MPKIIIIIFAAIILLAGGAITVMQQMELGPSAPKVDEAEAEKKKQAAKKKEPSLPRFITMDALTIPVIQGDRVALTLQLQLQIETSEERVDDLNKNMDRLKDAYIRDLHSFIPRLYRKSNILDTEALKTRLKVIGQRTIGKGIIDSVLIQNSLARPIPR